MTTDYQQLLSHQLEMNRMTWERLIANGYSSDKTTCLDFVYIAKVRKKAEELMRFLESETDYVIKIVSSDDEFEVQGQTKETALSLEILNDWVSWMVSAGARFDCVFDGWGTEVP